MKSLDRLLLLLTLAVVLTIVIASIVKVIREDHQMVPDRGVAQVISTSIYAPLVRHISPNACRTMFPAEEVGSLCDYYDGINLPDPCAPGYHLERQTTPGETGYVTGKVCHLDSARGERGVGLDCSAR